MARRIIFCNRKGGTGKTTTAVNVAAALSNRGHRVLLIDADPQAHSTLSLGFTEGAVGRDLGSFIQAGLDGGDLPMSTSHRFMQLIPASKQLSGFERLFFRTQDSKKRLSERLDGVEGGYDFIAIDTAPTLSFLNVSALIASNEVYIPFQAHFLSLEGLAEMISLVGKVRKLYEVDLRVKGVIPTFFNPRTRLSREILAEIRENLGERVLLCPVRQNIALAEAPSRGQTVFQYDPQSNGAVDYLRIAYQIEQLA